MFSFGNRLLKRQFKLLPKYDYILPFCFLGLTGFSFCNFFLLFFLSFRISELAERKATFVQLLNGQALTMVEKDEFYRHPEVIKNVVRQWVTFTFNWDGKILGTTELDKGKDIGGNKKVTTNAYFASFLIQTGKDGFRQAALSSISELTPSTVYDGKYRSNVIISFISEPRQIAPGEWEVDLVSTRILISSDGKPEEEINFNRTFTLKAADIPNPPQTTASLFEQQLYQIRVSGIEITKIVDFTAK